MRFWLVLAVVASLAAAVVTCREKVTEQVTTELDRLITDKVIEAAVDSLAADIRNGRNGSWSYAKEYGPTWTAGMKARHAVFAEHLGKGWFDLVYDRLDKGFRDYAMQTARESLDTPEELRAAYLRHKAKVIAEIRKQGIQNEVAGYAAYALPYFAAPGPGIGGLTDPYGNHGAKEWAERRRTEGGDALVAAWGEVIADLANSL